MVTNSATQPDFIDIDDSLRLRKFDDCYDFALKWYKDLATIKLIDNRDNEAYSKEKLSTMYNQLKNKGELYFIEVKEGSEFKAIGDVTFSQNDMPIVIGEKKYRGKGIGYKVVMALIRRAKDLGYNELSIKEIYGFNIGSQKTFEKAGFVKAMPTKNGYSYILKLK